MGSLFLKNMSMKNRIIDFQLKEILTMKVTKYYRNGDLIKEATGIVNSFGDLVIEHTNSTRYIGKYSYYDSVREVYDIIMKDIDDEIEELKARKEILNSSFIC